jgi:coproporphyrinogen III oxidase-like Fe-S oxidoreductase
VLTDEQRLTERVMLELRLADGVAASVLPAAGRAAAQTAAADGLLQPAALAGGRVVLTDRGRLLADGVVRALLP